MCSQNAANAISGAQISKNFRGGMAPDSPRILVPSARAPPIFHEVSATEICRTESQFTMFDFHSAHLKNKVFNQCETWGMTPF